MRAFAFTTATLALMMTSAPVLAGNGPLGNWRCEIGAVPKGTLTITPAKYEYVPVGGTYVMNGNVVIDQQLIHVVSGPLADLGINLGTYSTLPDNGVFYATGDWSGILTFNMAQGEPMLCNPRYDDPSLL